MNVANGGVRGVRVTETGRFRSLVKSQYTPMKANCCQGEKGMTWIPQDFGYRRTIWALHIKAREDVECNEYQSRNSNGNINSNGHRLVDRMKRYREATQK